MLVFRNSNRPVEEAGSLLCSFIEENRMRPVLFLASGGSSLKLLQHIRSDVVGENMTVSVLDERYSEDPSVNNFAQLSALPFFEMLKKYGCKVIDTRPKEGESCPALAQRFEDALRSWRAAHPEGRVIATQGIGENGHTAGIMPMPQNPERFRELFEKEHWVAAYHISPDINPYTERVTTTVSFLCDEVDVAVGFAVGEMKRAILKRVLDNRNTLNVLPARVMHQMKHVIMVSDVLE